MTTRDDTYSVSNVSDEARTVADAMCAEIYETLAIIYKKLAEKDMTSDTRLMYQIKHGYENVYYHNVYVILKMTGCTMSEKRNTLRQVSKFGCDDEFIDHIENTLRYIDNVPHTVACIRDKHVDELQRQLETYDRLSLVASHMYRRARRGFVSNAVNNNVKRKATVSAIIQSRMMIVACESLMDRMNISDDKIPDTDVCYPIHQVYNELYIRLRGLDVGMEPTQFEADGNEMAYAKTVQLVGDELRLRVELSRIISDTELEGMHNAYVCDHGDDDEF
jgi:hypothetical protein